MLWKQTRWVVTSTIIITRQNDQRSDAKTNNAVKWHHPGQNGLALPLVKKGYYSFLYTTPSFITNFTFPMTWIS